MTTGWIPLPDRPKARIVSLGPAAKPRPGGDGTKTLAIGVVIGLLAAALGVAVYVGLWRGSSEDTTVPPTASSHDPDPRPTPSVGPQSQDPISSNGEVTDPVHHEASATPTGGGTTVHSTSNLTDIRITWFDAATDGQIERVGPWTTVDFSLRFELREPWNVSFGIWGDTPFAPDIQIRGFDTLSLSAGLHVINGSFTTKPDILRGYVPRIYVNGTLEWHPQDFPPRLRLDMPWGKAVVDNVTWLIEGQPVDQVPPNTPAVARITMRADQGHVVDRLRLVVRTDVASAPDHDTADAVEDRVDMLRNSTRVYEVPFMSDDRHDVRGYYVVVTSEGRWWTDCWLFCGNIERFKTDLRQEGYPPRLPRSDWAP